MLPLWKLSHGLVALPDGRKHYITYNASNWNQCHGMCWINPQKLIIYGCRYLSEMCWKETCENWPKILNVPKIDIEEPSEGCLLFNGVIHNIFQVCNPISLPASDCFISCYFMIIIKLRVCYILCSVCTYTAYEYKSAVLLLSVKISIYYDIHDIFLVSQYWTIKSLIMLVIYGVMNYNLVNRLEIMLVIMLKGSCWTK